MVAVRVLTGALSPNAYGQLALGMTVVGFVQQTVTGPLGQASLRYYADAEEKRTLNMYVRVVGRLMVQACLLAGTVVLFVALLLLSLGHTNWFVLVLAALAVSLVSGFNGVLDSMQMAARQRAVVAWHQGLNQWLRPLLAISLIGFLGAGSSVVLIGYVFAGLFVTASQSMFLWRRIARYSGSGSFSEQSKTTRYRQQVVRYGWPFATWGLLTSLQLASDRWALQIFCDTKGVGLFTVAFQLGYYPILLVSTASAQLLSPVLFSRSGDGADPPRVERALALNDLVLYATLGGTLCATLLIYFLRSGLVSLLTVPAYYSAATYIPWLALAAGLFASGQVASQAANIRCTTHLLILPKLVTAAMGIAFNLIGAYWMGIAGVVFASVAFGFAYLVWMLFLARKLHGYASRLEGWRAGKQGLAGC